MEEEEVVLGLIPAPDWVENRPLKEGGDIELAAAKKLQHCKEADRCVEITPKKEKDDIEEITLDSEEEESKEVKIKPEEDFNAAADTPFQEGNEDEEIETTEEKHHIEAPIVFCAGVEDGELKMKQEEELQIEASTEFPEAEENEEVSMHGEEEEPHIEAVTVFSDSDEGETIQIKEEEELQIEAVTVYSDTESGEDSGSGQDIIRYNVQDNGGPITLSLAPPQATVIESAVQDVYGCNSCSKSFSCTGELSKHVRCHPPRRKPFICRVCLKTDSLAANLKRHMRTHSGEKPYSCILCLKMFTSAYSLKIHMRIHSGYKPYACKRCPRSFYQKTDLNKHNAIHFRAQELLQGARDLPQCKESNSLNHNVNVHNPPTATVYSQGVNSKVSHVPSHVSHYVLSPQSLVTSVNRNSRTDDSRTVNSQTESPSNVRHDSPAPFTPVITEVVGSFHEEDSEMQPCPSPSNNEGLQKRVSFHPTSSGGSQIRMEKAVYTQPVINSVNLQGANNTVALQDTALSASSSGGKQFAVKKNSVHKQSEMYLVNSQNEANSGTTFLSPVQFPTNVVQNNSSSAAAAPNTAFVNNEMFCIPLIINGQICYAIPAQTPSPLSVINNPAPIQTAVQPINPQNISSQETFLLPIFVPPISNGVPNPNPSQPTDTPTVIPQTLILGNTAPSQSQHQIGFQSTPVSTVTCVQPEISSGSQMTTVNTVPSVRSENSTESHMTTVESVPHCQPENSLCSEMPTVKIVPNVQPENSLGSQVTTVKTVPRGRPKKQFTLATPTVVGDEPVEIAHYQEHHHNHDLTVTMNGSTGTAQHERVYCNTCKAAVSVFTKRSTDKKVS